MYAIEFQKVWGAGFKQGQQVINHDCQETFGWKRIIIKGMGRRKKERQKQQNSEKAAEGQRKKHLAAALSGKLWAE